MSSVSTSDGKEASHRYRSLSLRKIRLEGLVPLLSFAFVSFRDGLHWAVSFSVLIRIEFGRSGHRNPDRSQRVQNANTLSVFSKDLWQSLVAVRRFVQASTA